MADTQQRRTPPGVRELKLILHTSEGLFTVGRTPPGVRELKRYYRGCVIKGFRSHPSRGA